MFANTESMKYSRWIIDAGNKQRQSCSKDSGHSLCPAVFQYLGLCEHSVLLMSGAEEKGDEDGASLSHKNIFVTMSLPAYSLPVICVFTYLS